MFTKLLVPLDNSPLAEQALPTAQSIARIAGAAMELVYVHQPQPYAGYGDAPWNAARRSSEESYVCAIADEVRKGANVKVEGSLATGAAAEAICARALDAGADLIVMTTHGRTGMSRAWLGSVADGVVRQTPIPVLLLRSAETKVRAKAKRASFDRILVPVDGSPASDMILGPAAALAAADGGRLIIVEIVPPIPLVVPDVAMSYGTPPMIPDTEATDAAVHATLLRLRDIAARLLRAGTGNVEVHAIVSQSPAQAILDAARAYSVDVVAMTSSGRGASRLVIGSVADKVLRASELPLLLCRPQSAETIERSGAPASRRISLASA